MSKRGYIFNSVQLRKAKRNPFNLSYENKLSCNMGKLYPFFINDVLPNDTFKVGQEYLMRAQPLIAPLMHRVDIYQHYFYTPYRLVWDDFERFITGGETGTETPEMPYFKPSELFGPRLESMSSYYQSWVAEANYPDFNSNNYRYLLESIDSYNESITLFDFLGYPLYKNQGINLSYTSGTDSQDKPIQIPVYNFAPGIFGEEKFSSLRIRCYAFVWDNYFRDENLAEPLFSPEWKANNGNDVNFISIYLLNPLGSLLPRPWKKDYFTSALPFQQRGPEVFIPNNTEIKLDNSKHQLIRDSQGNLVSGNIVAKNQVPSTALRGTIGYGTSFNGSDLSGTSNMVNIDPNGSLVNEVSISINELRRANALQRWFEKNARAGARYVEQVLGHFGIRPKDYRLDRPEYLGGGKQPFTIKDVVQTSGTLEDSTPQATQAGKGTASNAQYIFKQTFEEHGLLIGLLSVMPRASYQQGIDRHLQKFDKFDWAFPEFGNLGEQEVLNKELYYAGDVQDDNVFGYQSRYAEYKYNQDQIHGDMRSSLNYWHLGRIFENRPLLNKSFIYGKPRKDVFAVIDPKEDCMIFDIYNHCEVLRCLPAYGTPAL